MKFCVKSIAALLILAFEAVPVIAQGNSIGAHIQSISPAFAVTTPGTEVSVRGAGFEAGAEVYFGGIQGRITNFFSPTSLMVITPFLRPGRYTLQVKNGGRITESTVEFTALRSPVDATFDHARAAEETDLASAVRDLTEVANSNPDYQVRALASYEIGQAYFMHGDWWRWASATSDIFSDSSKSGMSIQTNWRYRVANELTSYYLPISDQVDHDLKEANFAVTFDVTNNPEPRFYRGLVCARYGDLAQAKMDSDFVLKIDPANSSYKALAEYVRAVSKQPTNLSSFSPQSISDPRALSILGEAAFLSGDARLANEYWLYSAKIYPLGADLACLAGQKHLSQDKNRIARSLLTECATMSPNSDEGLKARSTLASMPSGE